MLSPNNVSNAATSEFVAGIIHLVLVLPYVSDAIFSYQYS